MIWGWPMTYTRRTAGGSTTTALRLPSALLLQQSCIETISCPGRFPRPELPAPLQLKLRMISQNGIHQLAVFAGMNRAGGIHQASLRLEQRQQPIEQLPLQHHQFIDGSRINPPARIGMACQGAQA